MARPSAPAFNRLKLMFAASRLGITSRLAVPLRRLSGTARSRSVSISAASGCISPSTSSSGRAARIRARAWRIRRALSDLLDPNEECDISAALGTMPKARTASAARPVISATWAAVGSRFMCVSQTNSAPDCRIRQERA